MKTPASDPACVSATSWLPLSGSRVDFHPSPRPFVTATYPTTKPTLETALLPIAVHDQGTRVTCNSFAGSRSVPHKKHWRCYTAVVVSWYSQYGSKQRRQIGSKACSLLIKRSPLIPDDLNPSRMGGCDYTMIDAAFCFSAALNTSPTRTVYRRELSERTKHITQASAPALPCATGSGVPHVDLSISPPRSMPTKPMRDEWHIFCRVRCSYEQQWCMSPRCLPAVIATRVV